MINRTYRALGLGIVAVAAIALAQDSWTLKRTAKVGDAATYKLSADIDMTGLSGTLTATVTEKVLSVDPDGAFVLESVSKDAKFKVGDVETQVPEVNTSKSKYSPNGELLTYESNEGSAGYRLNNLSAFRFPDKALKVGDTWSTDLKADSKKSIPAATITYKVEAAEKVDKWDTLKIKTTVKETGVTDAAESDGYNWLEASTGVLVKSETKWTNVPFMGAPGPVNAKITIVRQS